MFARTRRGERLRAFAMTSSISAGVFPMTDGVWIYHNLDYSGVGTALVATGLAQGHFIVCSRRRGVFDDGRTAGHIGASRLLPEKQPA